MFVITKSTNDITIWKTADGNTLKSLINESLMITLVLGTTFWGHLRKNNDDYKYKEVATQEDYDKF